MNEAFLFLEDDLINLAEICVINWVDEKIKQIEQLTPSEKVNNELKLLDTLLGITSLSKRNHCAKFYIIHYKFDDLLERIFKNLKTTQTKLINSLNQIKNLYNKIKQLEIELNCIKNSRSYLKNLQNEKEKEIKSLISFLEEITILFFIRFHAFLESFENIGKIICNNRDYKVCLKFFEENQVDISKEQISILYQYFKCSTRNRLLHPPLITFHIYSRENEVFISLRPIEGEDIANTPSPLMIFLFNFLIFSKLFLLNCIYSICECSKAPNSVEDIINNLESSYFQEMKEIIFNETYDKKINWEKKIQQEIIYILDEYKEKLLNFLKQIEEKELELKGYIPSIFGTLSDFSGLKKYEKSETINELLQKFWEKYF